MITNHRNLTFWIGLLKDSPYRMMAVLQSNKIYIGFACNSKQITTCRDSIGIIIKI